MAENFVRTMESIVRSIRAAGYEPYSQLYGYVGTGNERFITRSGNARELVRGLNRENLREYLSAFSDQLPH